MKCLLTNNNILCAIQVTYESKLQESLQALRNSYENQMAENRAAFSATYDKKITDLTSKLGDERGSAATAVQVSSVATKLNIL